MIKIKENTVYNRLVQQFVCDNIDDMDNIPDNAPVASICFVIEGENGAEFYMKNSQNEWKKI